MLQPIIEKIDKRLPRWKKNFFSYTGRKLLVNFVLSSMPTYFLTVLRMPKWSFSKIDRYRRSFLWKCEKPDKIKGDHYLVNWKTCFRPKSLVGLGIKDLEKFSRALRLRWLWHQWDPTEKPWKPLLKVTNQIDRQLFFSSTTVQIGNGKASPFWESRWLMGSAPKELAPSLYEVARFKTRIVHVELQNNNWLGTYNKFPPSLNLGNSPSYS
jgi:hypothetical protein